MKQPTDPRFGAVTQLVTGANSHYNGLQLTGEKRLGHGLQAQVNYTLSHCIDTVSNGGFLQFSAGGILSPVPYDLARDRGPCDYDIRHNLTGNYVYQLPLKCAPPPAWIRAERVAGIRLRVLAQRHSVFCRKRAVYRLRRGHCGTAAVRSLPASCRACRSTITILSPASHNRERFSGLTRMHSSPQSIPALALAWAETLLQNCQFGYLGRKYSARSRLYLERFYLTKWFALSEHVKLRVEAQFFNVFNHPNFALPSIVDAGIPSGIPATQTGFGAFTSTTSPPTGLLGVGLGGEQFSGMIAFQGRFEF